MRQTAPRATASGSVQPYGCQRKIPPLHVGSRTPRLTYMPIGSMLYGKVPGTGLIAAGIAIRAHRSFRPAGTLVRTLSARPYEPRAS